MRFEPLRSIAPQDQAPYEHESMGVPMIAFGVTRTRPKMGIHTNRECSEPPSPAARCVYTTAPTMGHPRPAPQSPERTPATAFSLRRRAGSRVTATKESDISLQRRVKSRYRPLS